MSSSDDIPFEYESDERDSEDEDQESLNIENMFYEAEDQKSKKPEEALEKYEKILNHPESTRSANWKLKALRGFLGTCFVLKNFPKFLTVYTNFLESISTISLKNDSTEIVKYVLENLTDDRNGVPVDMTFQIYDLTLEKLKQPATAKLWLVSCLKIAQACQTRGSVDLSKNYIGKLKAFLIEDPILDSEDSLYFEIYSLELQHCHYPDDLGKMKDLCQKIRPLANSVVDNQILAIFRQTEGDLFMRERKWKHAYQDYLDAFQLHQSSGNNIPEAKKALIRMLMCNMASMSEINPFQGREARAFQDDPDVSELLQLRNAFDERNLEVVIEKYGLLKLDVALKKCFDDFLTDFKYQHLLEIIEPYKTIHITTLCGFLCCTTEELKAMLCRAVLDDQRDLQLDEFTGFVTVVRENKIVLDEVKAWANSLDYKSEKLLWAWDNYLAASF